MPRVSWHLQTWTECRFSFTVGLERAFCLNRSPCCSGVTRKTLEVSLGPCALPQESMELMNSGFWGAVPECSGKNTLSSKVLCAPSAEMCLHRDLPAVSSTGELHLRSSHRMKLGGYPQPRPTLFAVLWYQDFCVFQTLLPSLLSSRKVHFNLSKVKCQFSLLK